MDEESSGHGQMVSASAGAAGAGTGTGWWNPASTDVMNQLCRVCGEPAAGFHFGAFTCEGCKSFFGRTYNNLGSISECKNQGTCVINKKNRTSCKACRLRKCLLVGMSKSGSRYGRRSNWFKIHCLLQEQQHQQQQQQPLRQQPTGRGPSPPDKTAKEPPPPAAAFPALWAPRGALLHPGPPPHIPLPFLGAPFLPMFATNGASPLFGLPPPPPHLPQIPRWQAAPAPVHLLRETASPLPSPRRPPVAGTLLNSPPGSSPPPRHFVSESPSAPVQDAPMDLSRTASTYQEVDSEDGDERSIELSPRRPSDEDESELRVSSDHEDIPEDRDDRPRKPTPLDLSSK